MTRRYYRDPHAHRRCGSSTGRAAAAHRRLHARGARLPRARHHRAHRPAGPATGEPLVVQADLRQIIAGCRPSCAVQLDLYVTAGEAPDADLERSAEKIRALLGTLPERLARVAVAVRRAGATSARRGSPSGRTRRRGPVEDRTLRGLHPMVAERLGLWRLSELRADPAAVADRRAPVPGGRQEDAGGPAADGALRRPRPGGAARGRRADPALPQLEHVLDACLDALRAARAADRADARLDWNRVLLYVWPVVDLPLDEFDAVVAGWPRAPRGWGWSRSLVQFRRRPRRDGRRRELLLRLSRPPGAGLTVAGHRSPDRAAARAGRLHAEGDPGPPPRRGLPVRAGPDAAAQPGPGRRAGTFTEYDLDASGSAVPVDRPPGRTRPTSSWARSHADPALPRGHDRRGADRRPDQGAGGDRRAECRRVLAALGAREELSAPGRVVRRLRRRQDRHGLRHREHGLDLPRAARADRVHPGRRRDQRRRDRASTSARSRTGTPRRRCSCTPRASS